MTSALVFGILAPLALAALWVYAARNWTRWTRRGKGA